MSVSDMVHPRPARYLTRLADRLRPYNVAETLLPPDQIYPKLKIVAKQRVPCVGLPVYATAVSGHKIRGRWGGCPMCGVTRACCDQEPADSGRRIDEPLCAPPQRGRMRVWCTAGVLGLRRAVYRTPCLDVIWAQPVVRSYHQTRRWGPDT